MTSFAETLFHSSAFFPVFFVVLWCSVGFIISRFGWHAFAKRYPVHEKPAGIRYTASKSWFGSNLASYRNVVRVAFTENGIHCSVMLPFRAFHPPFLLPWASVKSVERKEGFFFGRVRLNIEDACGEMHLLLPLKAADPLAARLTTG
jgi:hypothetical protein